MDEAKKGKRSVGPRQHHVAAHQVDGHPANGQIYNEILVFGTELDALRHIVGKPGWEYQALANGQPFGEDGS